MSGTMPPAQSKTARWLRTAPFGSARTRILLWNMAAAFSGRAINLLSTLIAIPLAVASLGEEQYGAFAVVISPTTLFAHADFGLDFAMLSELAHPRGRGAPARAHCAVCKDGSRRL